MRCLDEVRMTILVARRRLHTPFARVCGPDEFRTSTIIVPTPIESTAPLCKKCRRRSTTEGIKGRNCPPRLVTPQGGRRICSVCRTNLNMQSNPAFLNIQYAGPWDFFGEAYFCSERAIVTFATSPGDHAVEFENLIEEPSSFEGVELADDTSSKASI